MGKIQRPENENEFTIFGVRYVAKDHPYCPPICRNGGLKCAFLEMYPNCRFLNRPHCTSMKRRDGRYVIFVRAEENCEAASDGGQRTTEE